MPKKMEPTPKGHYPSLADRVDGRTKVVTFYKSGDKNFKGVRIPIRKKYNFGTLLSDLDRVSNFPFGVRRIVTPSATHDVTNLNDFEDGKMYIMAPSKKKLEPLDLSGIQSKPPWSNPKNRTDSSESDLPSPRKTPSIISNGASRELDSRLRTVKKIMVMRNGDPHTKHMMLLNRNKIPSFEAFLTDIGESFQLPAQKLYTADGQKVESLSAIFNGVEDLFIVGTGVEKFRPGSYKENSPFKTSSRQRESLRRKSMDETDQPPQKIVKKSRGKFRAWVATSENPAAGTDAVVSLTVYGDKGKSDDIVLGCGDGKFESGNEDEFMVSVGNVGDIFKIRIGHDESTEFAGWLCEEVRLQDIHTGDEIVFPCGRWMSRSEEDGEICRELPAIIDGNPVYPVLNYYVAVVTGNYWDAATSADVYITLYGERGDTGPRLLFKTKRAKKFDKGKTDVFNIEAVSLGLLQKILIGHNSTQPGDGWYLEKVTVKEHKGSSQESVFPCNCWLDATQDEDSKTSRELFVNNKPKNLEKEMWNQEKWKFLPGNQLVFINKGLGKAIQIKPDGTFEATSDPFTNNKTAKFEVQKIKDNIYSISSVASPDSFIAFDGNKISAKGKGNELKLRVQPDRTIVMETVKSSPLLVTFGQTGKPGDCRGPSLGPTRQFYCYTKGMFRDEGIVMFNTSRIQTLTVPSDKICLATGHRSEDAYWRVRKIGESGSIRMFESLSKPDSYLRIKDGHCDVQGSGDTYCQFKVDRVKDKGYITLQSVSSPDVCIGFVSDGTVKPTVDTGEDNVRLYPEVIQFGTKKHLSTPTPPVSAKPAINRKKRVMAKQASNNAKKAPVPIPLTPTPTPSPPVKEKSFYDANKLLEYPSTPTPTPTPEGGDYDEYDAEFLTSPSRTPTPVAPTPIPTPTPVSGNFDDYDADGDWKVWVKTGKVATKASVVLVVYGDDGVSQPFTLGKGGKELFKTGEENNFKVNVLSVGDIYKIRIGLDTTSKKVSWKLDQVKMKDMITDEQLVFKFKNRWFSFHEDDGDVWRESPVVRPGVKPLPVLKYCIEVRTGSEEGSSTDAEVYMCLHGEKGDTGQRVLNKSNQQDKFKQSQSDIFELEAVSVMTPTKIVIGHRGSGSGAGWFLNDVIIKENKTAKTEYVFPCNRWLDEGQDDKLIERELELGEVREIKPHEWQVYVITGSDTSAGTTAMVTLVAYGDKDMTEVALIPQGEDGFLPGKTQDVRVYLGDIGQLFKIRIGHDNCAPNASWYLKTVRMVNLNEDVEVQFDFDRWLSEKHDDFDVWRELPAVLNGKKPLPVTRYYIQVYTGKENNSNTNANVYMQLSGKNGDSGKRHLIRSKNNKENKFKVGQMDVFEIEAVYLGRLQKVIVGHDGKEAGQGWYLEKVVIKESRNAKNELFFPCKKWLDAGQDDQKIERELVPSKPSSAPNPVTSESATCQTNSITVAWKQPSSGRVKGYRVTCDPPDCPAAEVIITDVKTTKAEFGGLTAGKAYQFDIVATNGEVDSDKVILKANAKPNPVLDASLESTQETIIATWTHPDGELSGYKLRISPSDAKKPVLKIKDTSTTRAEFTGLTPSKKYKVDIVAVSGESDSEKVTLQESTKMPEIHVLTVSEVRPTKPTTNSLTVSWDKPEGDVNGYRLLIQPAEGATPEIKMSGAGKTTAEFKGLSSGQEYTVEVYTVYNDQESDKMTVTARTESESNQPKDPAATSTTDTIDVTWSKPEGTVTAYRVVCFPDDAVEVKIDDGETTTAKFEGLAPGRQYGFEIYAFNGDTESEKTTLTQITKPNAVIDPIIESSSTDVINLTWTKPEGDMTGYRIDYQPIKDSETASGDDQDKPVDGVADGQDKPSNEEEKADVLDAPSQDNINENSVDKETNNQDKSNDGENQSDDQAKPDDGENAESKSTSIEGGETTKAEITGLVPGQSYQFHIITMSEEVGSEPVIIKGTTKPLPVVDPKTESTTDTVTVRWTFPDGQYTGFRIVCSQKDEESQNGSKETKPAEEENSTKEENSAINNQDQGKSNNNEKSDPGNPGDEISETNTQPPTEEQKDDSKAPDDGSKHIVNEKKVSVSEVEFTGLQQKTTYCFEIYTVCGEMESEVATVEETTKKDVLPTQGEWKVWITTDDDSKPANNSKVHLVVYGDKGKTEPIVLNKEDLDNFYQPGNTDQFDVSVGEIGEIYKIRIGRDDDDDNQWEGWHLKQVKMIDQHTEEELLFDFDRWMSRHEDDFDIVRELPAVRQDKEVLPVNVYHVSVSTGEHWAAYTDAKVWVILHGDRGDTGKRVLYHSLNQPCQFTKGQVDEFKVEAVCLGDVSRVEIGHDGIGYGAGIFINSVTVRENAGADQEYLFACNSWLDDHMEDRQTQRQLQLLGIRPVKSDTKDEPSAEKPDRKWTVAIKTSEQENAGTTALVHLTVFGEMGKSRHPLEGKALETNTEQEFEVEMDDIGEITKIRLEHDNSGDSPAWHVQHVTLMNPNQPELLFRVNAWLSSEEGESPATMREVVAIRPGVEPLPVVQYTVQVYIKEDAESASTNPNLHIALMGTSGELMKHELTRTSQPVSQEGKVTVDTFHFDAVSVGQLHKAILTISSNEKQDTWFVEKVTIQEARYAKSRYVFASKMWFGNAIIGEDGNTVLEADLQLEGEEAVPKDNKDADEEDDGESASKGNWTIWITPGKENGIGTNSNLFVQVYGVKGSSEVIPLKPQEEDKAKEDEGDKKDEEEEKGDAEKESPPQEKDAVIEDNGMTDDKKEDIAFPPGCVKDFNIEVGEIGPIYKIRLILDEDSDKDDRQSIFLEKVKMKDKDTNQEFHFFINRWLRHSEDIPASSTNTESPKSESQDKPEEQDTEPEVEDKSDAKKKKSKKEKEKKSKKSKKTKADDKKSKEDEKTKEEAKSKKDEKTKEGAKNKEEEVGEQQEDVKKETSDENIAGYIELPAIRPDIPPLPVNQYELSVHTGDKGAASYDGVIYATLYGQRGDTGKRVMRKFNNNAQVDLFTIEAVDILRPSSITIGHGSEGLGAGWYLDKVTVKQSTSATIQYVFPCKRWLDTGVDDRKLERNLPLLGEVECPIPVTSDTKGHWQVKVKTSEQADAGTSSKVVLIVYGEKGQKSQHLLEKEAFLPGSVEEFEVSVGEIGAISKIQLQHDNTGDNPAWHVNTVSMKDVDSNEEIQFVFYRWFSRDKDTKQICHELPAIRDEQESLQVHNYQVKVHTGDVENATTKGDIYVTLHGSKGDSGQCLLVESNNEKKFAQGQIDTFTVQVVDLGKIHSVSVSNPSPDSAHSWYLDKMTIKTNPKAEEEFIFISSQWIGAMDEEKEELKTAVNDVELLLQEKWKCTVHTSDIPDCGTDAEVSLVAYGDKGMSKVMVLTNGQKENFEPGKIAEFELEPGAYIGDVYKIRLQPQDGQEKSWHLKRVDVKDCFSDECLRFEYNRWLSLTENDGKEDIVAEIPVLRPDQEPLEVVRYYMQVFTGEAEDAGTDSEVSVMVYGENGDTGRRLLNKPRDGGKPFDKAKKKDLFDFEAVSIGSVTRVVLDKAAGTPWYLDKLILKEGEFAAMETEFSHNSWLGDKDQPEQPVHIELLPTNETPSQNVAELPEGQEPVQTKGDWIVYITTGDKEKADIEANVSMTVYGNEGISQALPLGQQDQPTKMEKGQTQEFKINVGEVGEIYKVRLEHDGKDDQSSWFVEKIKMKDSDTKAEFSYTLSRWLSRDMEGCDCIVEIPAVWPERQLPQVITYDIEVVTGDEDDAGTQSNVYMTLRGKHSDTGRRNIVRHPGDTTLFSKGQTDKLTLEAMSLGQLEKCIVGHDGSEPDSGWLLDKITVRESGQDMNEVVFSCNKWLAVDKGDKQTEIELDVLPPSEGGIDASPDAGDEPKGERNDEKPQSDDDKEKDDAGDNVAQ